LQASTVGRGDCGRRAIREDVYESARDGFSGLVDFAADEDARIGAFALHHAHHEIRARRSGLRWQGGVAFALFLVLLLVCLRRDDGPFGRRGRWSRRRRLGQLICKTLFQTKEGFDLLLRRHLRQALRDFRISGCKFNQLGVQSGFGSLGRL
jgi:hypothetical protein